VFVGEQFRGFANNCGSPVDGTEAGVKFALQELVPPWEMGPLFSVVEVSKPSKVKHVNLPRLLSASTPIRALLDSPQHAVTPHPRY